MERNGKKDNKATAANGAGAATEEQLREALRIVREDGSWGNVVLPADDAWGILYAVQEAIAAWQQPTDLGEEGERAWATLERLGASVVTLARAGREDFIAMTEKSRGAAAGMAAGTGTEG